MRSGAFTLTDGRAQGGWLDLIDDRGQPLAQVGRPTVRVLSDCPAFHIPGWRVLPGGAASQSREAESGFISGYFRPELDDSDWYGAPRINDVPFGYPTWEGDSFHGYLWYRAEIDSPGACDEEISIRLGSPAEVRAVEWTVYIDAELVSAGNIRPLLELNLSPGSPGHQALCIAGRHLIAVQLRVTNPNETAVRRREAEGWRRVDPFCFQYVSWGPAWSTVSQWADHARSERAGTLEAPGVSIDYDVEVDGAELTLRSFICNDSSATVCVSEVSLAAVRWPGQQPRTVTEGAFAYTENGWFAAAAHPGQLTIVDGDAAVPTVWIGRTLRPGESAELPTTVVVAGAQDCGRATFREYLSQHGQRKQQHLAIYDPYGWYQISHASEPKIELTDELATDIGATLARARSHGVAFDYLALDCGWNDPDDYRFFHPTNMPSGGDVVRGVAKAQNLKLMLWASPSDGPRAFRHELGLQTPGFEDCLSGNPVLPWRLCPAAPRWRDTFREALLSHLRQGDVHGFKIDGTDVWCSGEHDHRPGIWSVYATAEALRHTFEELRSAGAEMIMLYWGLRSPWWLLWGNTLYDRGYLVEAAAPSGTRAWGLRSSVASSQDIGHQASWLELPAVMKDSLGVWISDTAWASWQGDTDWADAVVMDVGRGSRLTQMWGNLNRLMDDDGDARRFGQTVGLETSLNKVLNGEGQPILSAAWEDGPYGYLWRSGDEAVAFVSNPEGELCSYRFDAVEDAQSVAIRYCTPGVDACANLVGGEVRVAQAPGSVVVVATSTSPGPTFVGRLPAHAHVMSWGRTAQSDSPVSADLAEQVAKTCYLGRGPQIQPWMAGATYADQSAQSMSVKLPQPDRDLRELTQNWAGRVTLAADGELAIVVRFSQDGAAWHNDRLHELCRLETYVNGVSVAGSVLPYRAHEQAGSWTWMISRQALPAGEHRVELLTRAHLPRSVEMSAEAWVRSCTEK